MTSRLLPIALLAGLLLPRFAHAGNGSDCESIGESDQRNYCRAVAKHDKSACESINNADRRNYCRAVAGHDKSSCESIGNADLRNRCRAEAG